MKPLSLFPLLLLILLTTCGRFEAGLQPSASPTASSIPSATVAIHSSETPTALQPVETALLPTETAPAATQGPQFVQIFLIALGDQGVSSKKIGCGDSVIPVQVQIPPTQGVLKAALQVLLSVKVQYYGESGLYNALYQSDLKLESATITDGKAVVKLTGKLVLGGECDNPRVAAQLEETVLQFSTVSEVSIFINGKPLSEVLSLRG